jgi:hypothetical protein
LALGPGQGADIYGGPGVNYSAVIGGGAVETLAQTL